jgi:hypothetical protein
MRLHVTRTPKEGAQTADVSRERAYRGAILAVVAWKRSLPAQCFPNPVIDYFVQLLMDAKVPPTSGCLNCSDRKAILDSENSPQKSGSAVNAMVALAE